MKQQLVTSFAGVVFAIGLGISGMTNPAKVIGFLDVTGAWDPSLALVMGGAIAIHVSFAQWSRRAARPWWADTFVLPRRTDVDTRLLAGAALFGLGWGTAGYCPGPALVSLVSLRAESIIFCASMVAGIGAFHALAAGRRRPGPIVS